MDARVTEFAVADAKARFSELVARAESGEAITIKRHGQAVARLVPIVFADQSEKRKQAVEDFIAWRNENVKPFPGRIDYKALINAGRKY
ncbi:MAG: type II toxin-antitoxin system Phd/YefM family antitoxin [Sphingomonadaceae bacterium]